MIDCPYQNIIHLRKPKMKNCLICNKEFKNQIALNSHLKVHNKNYVKPKPPKSQYLNCVFCDNLLTKSNLKKHEYSCFYNPINYNECKECKSHIHHNKLFCNTSCSAIFNNKLRPPTSDETKKKISLSSKGKKFPNRIQGSCKLFEHTCKICKRFALVNYKQNQRKTCSRKCQTIASTSIRTYQNGSRKTTWYFNKYQNKDVLLESSWEVKTAELLDSLNIEWIRPQPIDWIDTNMKSHLYYPDFYLVQTDTYLDPKNPYCMEKDKEKLADVSKSIKLIYGSLETIEKYVLSEYSDLN